MVKPVSNVEHFPGFSPLSELLGDDPHPLEEGREEEQLCGGGDSEGRMPGSGCPASDECEKRDPDTCSVGYLPTDT